MFPKSVTLSPVCGMVQANSNRGAAIMPANKNSNWNEFLAMTQAGLDAFRQRVDKAQKGEDSPVIYKPSASQAQPDEVLVGVGDWREDHKGICLNNKGVGAFLEEQVFFDSVTSLVRSDHKKLWNHWREVVGSDSDPERFFRRFVLVVEDASPDSCFGLLLLLARLNNVSPEDIPQQWVSYMRRWEQGDVTSTGLPEQSYGAMHNALAHSHAGSAWGSAWNVCLEFLIDALRFDVDPAEIGQHGPRWPSLAHARALINFERQVYEDSLTYAITLQLRLPIKDAPNRYRLVDAYLAEEHQPLGMAKVFLRNDSENPYLEAGFTLMAIYKPGEPGSGNDMTISLMTGRGVHLKDLWEELERRENIAWRGKRDCSNPRKDVVIYPDGKDTAGKPAPTQPWFITRDYDLIGAPKSLKVDASRHADLPSEFIVDDTQASGGNLTVLGSRLSWDDVCEAIWKCYQPFQDFCILSRDNEPVSLAQCKPEPTTDPDAISAGKCLIQAKWYNPRSKHNRSASAQPAGNGPAAYQHQAYIRFTPTLKRYLAACIDCAHENDVALKDLPQADHYDFIELSGGFAVVTRSGAFVIDDWRLDPLKADEVLKEYENVCIRLGVIKKMRNEVQQLYLDIERELKSGLRGSKVPKLVNRLAAMKLQVGKRWAETMTETFDPGVMAFREALEARFGVAGRLQSFYNSVDRIGAMLGNYIDLKTNRRVAFLSLYGFPVVLVASFFSGMLTQIEDSWTPWSLPPLALFGLFSVAGVLVVLCGNFIFDKATRLKEADYKNLANEKKKK